MSFATPFGDEATADFREIAAYYRRIRRSLGTDFVAELDRAVVAIAATPTMHPPAFADLRRHTMRRFKHHVYYRIVADGTPTVVGVVHHSRDSAGWQARAMPDPAEEQ